MPIVLDFNPTTNFYILRVPRGAADPQAIMGECGFNWSMPESTVQTAVLYTAEPYAAATFHKYATPVAAAKLGWLMEALAASSALTSKRHVALPPDKELIPFQAANVDYILSRTHALDGDEMGLGKTPTAIAVANEMQAERVLVICPAHIRKQWYKRIAEWTTLPDVRRALVIAGNFGVSNTANYMVISYELARNPGIRRALTKMRFDLLIVDEAHYVKSLAAARSRAIFGYFDHKERVEKGELEIEENFAPIMSVCERVLLLTGTPSPNRPAELYPFFRALCWDAIDWRSEKDFRERFNPQSKGKTASDKVWTHEEEGRLPELQNRLRAGLMCRHLEEQVKHQLKAAFPNPIHDLIYLEETEAIRAALEAERMLDIDPENLAGADMETLGMVSTVRKEMGLAMAPQVAEHIDWLLSGGQHKLVVFTWHQEVTDYLIAALASWHPLWTDGRNTSRKEAVCQAFIDDPNRRVLIGNILTLGTGTDGLQQVAHRCLFAEPDWVPGNNDQCVKRLARIGQESRVLADFAMVRNSYSEKILATSLRKGVVVHKSLDRIADDIVYAK